MEGLLNQILESPSLNVILLPSVLLLGILTAVSSCCNLAIIAAIAGYAGTNESNKRSDMTFITLSFILGILLSFSVIGVVISYIGQAASEYFSHYGKIIAGLVIIFFGLMALNLVPIKLPRFKQVKIGKNKGLFKAIVFGFALGGSSVTCSLACYAPVIPILLGVSFLQGQEIKGAFTMALFAIGYSLPMAAILFGISFGKWTLRANKVISVIRYIGGILLLITGFYFLLSM